MSKLKKLQDELEHVVTENGKEQTMIVREKEEAINRLKKEVKEIQEKFSNPLKLSRKYAFNFICATKNSCKKQAEKI